MDSTHVTILGAGYVGLTTATLLACAGYRVCVVEPNPSRLATIKTGKSFFYEEGLDILLTEVIKNNKLSITDSYLESIFESSVVFSCVGTPDYPDGSPNLEYVFSAAKQASELMSPGSVFVQKSTVPVGTGRKLMKFFEKSNVTYVSNPEFLREGTALSDTLYFDRVVVGSDDKSAVEIVLDLYRQIESQRGSIAKKANITLKNLTGEYIITGLESAELIKVTSNAFLALKISFANSIAMLSDKVGADIKEVMYAVGSDARIGRAFLNAGRGYGGGCFPKDVSGLISSSAEAGVEQSIMKSVQAVNDTMPYYIINQLINYFNGDLKDRSIAVLGLAFKPGTSDVRKSPGIKIANLLQQQGANVMTYDPKAREEAKPQLHPSIKVADELSEALKNAFCLIITTDWPEFNNISKCLNDVMVIYDAVNMLDFTKLPVSIDYLGVGLSRPKGS